MTGETQHTPGPWSWVKRDGEFAYLRYEHPEGGGEYVLSPESEQSDYGLSSRETVDVSEANAALIAAAPEMFEALKAVLADDEFCELLTAEREQQARAALAKATSTPA